MLKLASGCGGGKCKAPRSILKENWNNFEVFCWHNSPSSCARKCFFFFLESPSVRHRLSSAPETFLRTMELFSLFFSMCFNSINNSIYVPHFGNSLNFALFSGFLCSRKKKKNFLLFIAWPAVLQLQLLPACPISFFFLLMSLKHFHATHTICTTNFCTHFFEGA